jgi:hypothetical protein
MRRQYSMACFLARITAQGKRGGSWLGVATAWLLINKFPPLGARREARARLPCVFRDWHARCF